VVTRGFKSSRARGDPSRVPPGQYVTNDFPVLSAGPTPRTLRSRRDLPRAGAGRGSDVSSISVCIVCAADADRSRRVRDEVEHFDYDRS